MSNLQLGQFWGKEEAGNLGGKNTKLIKGNEGYSLQYYKVPQTLITGDSDSENANTLEQVFFDFQIKYDFQEGHNYYINFRPEKRIDRDYDLRVYLWVSQNTKEYTQYIDRYTIIKGGNDNGDGTMCKGFYNYEIVFQPDTNYTHLRFEIVRSTQDYLDTEEREISVWNSTTEKYSNFNSANKYTYKKENAESKLVTIENSQDYKDFVGSDTSSYIPPNGMVIEVEIKDFQEIGNILSNDIICKRIGVQANPKLIMCINGECIQVGQSGLYEPIADYKIDFFGIVPRENSQIMIDYQYIDKVGS